MKVKKFRNLFLFILLVFSQMALATGDLDPSDNTVDNFFRKFLRRDILRSHYIDHPKIFEAHSEIILLNDHTGNKAVSLEAASEEAQKRKHTALVKFLEDIQEQRNDLSKVSTPQLLTLLSPRQGLESLDYLEKGPGDINTQYINNFLDDIIEITLNSQSGEVHQQLREASKQTFDLIHSLNTNFDELAKNHPLQSWIYVQLKEDEILARFFIQASMPGDLSNSESFEADEEKKEEFKKSLDDLLRKMPEGLMKGIKEEIDKEIQKEIDKQLEWERSIQEMERHTTSEEENEEAHNKSQQESVEEPLEIERENLRSRSGEVSSVSSENKESRFVTIMEKYVDPAIQLARTLSDTAHQLGLYDHEEARTADMILTITENTAMVTISAGKIASGIGTPMDVVNIVSGIVGIATTIYEYETYEQGTSYEEVVLAHLEALRKGQKKILEQLDEMAVDQYMYFLNLDTSLIVIDSKINLIQEHLIDLENLLVILMEARESRDNERAQKILSGQGELRDRLTALHEEVYVDRLRNKELLFDLFLYDVLGKAAGLKANFDFVKADHLQSKSINNECHFSFNNCSDSSLGVVNNIEALMGKIDYHIKNTLKIPPFQEDFAHLPFTSLGGEEASSYFSKSLLEEEIDSRLGMFVPMLEWLNGQIDDQVTERIDTSPFQGIGNPAYSSLLFEQYLSLGLHLPIDNFRSVRQSEDSDSTIMAFCDQAQKEKRASEELRKAASLAWKTYRSQFAKIRDQIYDPLITSAKNQFTTGLGDWFADKGDLFLMSEEELKSFVNNLPSPIINNNIVNRQEPAWVESAFKLGAYITDSYQETVQLKNCVARNTRSGNAAVKGTVHGPHRMTFSDYYWGEADTSINFDCDKKVAEAEANGQGGEGTIFKVVAKIKEKYKVEVCEVCPSPIVPYRPYRPYLDPYKNEFETQALDYSKGILVASAQNDLSDLIADFSPPVANDEDGETIEVAGCGCRTEERTRTHDRDLYYKCFKERHDNKREKFRDTEGNIRYNEYSRYRWDVHIGVPLRKSRNFGFKRGLDYRYFLINVYDCREGSTHYFGGNYVGGEEDSYKDWGGKRYGRITVKCDSVKLASEQYCTEVRKVKEIRKREVPSKDHFLKLIKERRQRIFDELKSRIEDPQTEMEKDLIKKLTLAKLVVRKTILGGYGKKYLANDSAWPLIQMLDLLPAGHGSGRTLTKRSASESNFVNKNIEQFKVWRDLIENLFNLQETLPLPAENSLYLGMGNLLHTKLLLSIAAEVEYFRPSRECLAEFGLQGVGFETEFLLHQLLEI